MFIAFEHPRRSRSPRLTSRASERVLPPRRMTEHHGKPDGGLRSTIVAEARSAPRAVYWFAVVWFVLGHVIDFYPGAEQWYFILGGFLAVAGFLVPRWTYRCGAALLIVVSLFWAMLKQRHVEMSQGHLP